MKTNLFFFICLAVLCVILTLGLWPFHSPSNHVSWIGNRHGLRFARFGIVTSSTAFRSMSRQKDSEVSLEIWLQPRFIWDYSTFLAFYRDNDLRQFSLQQLQTDLSIGAEAGNYQSKTLRLDIKGIFRKSQPSFITITSGAKGTRVYLDGVTIASAPQLHLSGDHFTGRMVLGDAPGQTDDWSGELLGLAIYSRDLSEARVLNHSVTWQQNGQPEMRDDDRNIALYLFKEGTGSVVRDNAVSGVNLCIPEKYKVMNKVFLEPVWTELMTSRGYWEAAIKNVVGFIPFGFCFYMYMVTQPRIRRPMVATIALGAAASLMIEILQAFLPTRESGITDIITNTLGTSMGVASYKSLRPTLARLFPKFPFSVGPHK